MDPLGPLLLVLLLTLFAACVQTLNAALPGVDEDAFEERAQQGASHERRVLRLLERFDHGFGEIRMTYAFLLTALGLTLWLWLGGTITQALSLPRTVVAILFVLLYTLLAFALTSVIPGGIAARFPEKALKIISLPAECAVVALTPVTRGAFALGALLLKPFHITPGRVAEHVTEEEILQMVDIGEEKGSIEADEKEMIENIFEFNNMTAEDCMVHRKDITAIDASATDDDVLSTIAESGLSRFPVYEGSIDNVIGLLTSRDFLLNRCSEMPRPFRQLIRPAHFVPESVRTDTLFHDMQTRKQHMAIVIDEYGGTSGLITLEDLLEEIVGNIYDEFDPKEVEDITPLPDGRWRVSGSTELERVNEALKVELPLDEEYDTLGGLVFSRLTEIPADGERPQVECFGLRISVTEVADRRVEWAIVEKLPTEEKE